MASMESFYGGRQGASFVIVKRFDGLDIPQIEGSFIYRKKYYAVSQDGSYYLCDDNGLIERSELLEDTYSWLATDLNGSIVNTKHITTGVIGTTALPNEKAEGMRQCFEKGGDTTNIVNYGEYVIIDTIAGLQNSSNLDNGKVYRRGMNFDYNPLTNPLAGAEYIGQITGPRGKATELGMDTINNITAITGATVRTYDLTNDSLVPGKTINPSTGLDVFNDGIDYAWVNVKDSLGEIKQALIGFTFPYLVEEFIGRTRLPYYQNGDVIPAGSQVGDILPSDFEYAERIDDGTHPFYQKWKFNIPKGIKGDSLDDLEIYPTKAHAGATIYNDSALTVVSGTAVGTENIDTTNYNSSLNYIALTNGKYISINDGWALRVRYKLHNYDNTQTGSYSFVDIGSYNTIENIELVDDGTFTVHYTFKPDQVESKAIPWIRSVSLDSTGHFKVVYNNDNSNRIVNTTGTETEGGVTRAIYEATLSTVTDVLVNTANASGIEGSGTQKVAVEYNDTGVYTEVGQPLNYVLDTHVVNQNDINDHPGDASLALLKGHLCVYYSDPIRRASSTITLYSNRLGRDVLGWIDLGDIRGETNAQLTFAEYPSLASIPNQPPEVIMGTTVGGVLYPDYRYMGWGVRISPATVGDSEHLALYDYINQGWVDVGPLIDYASITPNMTIAYQDDISVLREGGFVVDKSVIRKTVN